MRAGIRAAAIAALTRPTPKVEEPTPEPVALEVMTPEPEELAAVAGGVLEEAAAVVEEAAAALAEPVIEVEPAELLDIEEVPVPEELAPVAALAPIAEPEPVFEEVAVPAFPNPLPKPLRTSGQAPSKRFIALLPSSGSLRTWTSSFQAAVATNPRARSAKVRREEVRAVEADRLEVRVVGCPEVQVADVQRSGWWRRAVQRSG